MPLAALNSQACVAPLPQSLLEDIGQILQKNRLRGLGRRWISCRYTAASVDQEFLEIPADIARKAIFGRAPGLLRPELIAGAADHREILVL
jgi:hypothetical protein